MNSGVRVNNLVRVPLSFVHLDSLAAIEPSTPLSSASGNQSIESQIKPPKSEVAALPDAKHSASTRVVVTPTGESPTNSKGSNVIHSPVSFSSNDLHTFDESFVSSHSSTASASSSPSSSTRYHTKERRESEERSEQPCQQRPNVIQMPLHRPIPIKHDTVPLTSPSTSLPQASYQPTASTFFRPPTDTSSSLANLSNLLNDYWRRIALNLPATQIQQTQTPLLTSTNNNGGLWIPQSIPQIGTIPQRLNLPSGGREAAEQSLLPSFGSTAFQPAQTGTNSYSNSLYAMAAALATNQATVPTTSAELAAQFQAALARQTDLGLASYQRFLASEQVASNVFKQVESARASVIPKIAKSESGNKIEPKVSFER